MSANEAEPLNGGIVMDLFCGEGGFSQAFEEDPSWGVTTIDIEDRFDPDICENILNIQPDQLPEADVVLASPPCNSFSIGSIFHHWHYHTEQIRMPESESAYTGIKLVYKTLYLIRQIRPTYWFMENPRGGLRKVIGLPQGTVSWCQYWSASDYEERGRPPMKPTDLWGMHPPSFEYCICHNGAGCHQQAPRGEYTGTQDQDLTPAERAKIPKGLSMAVKEAVENPGSNTVSQRTLAQV